MTEDQTGTAVMKPGDAPAITPMQMLQIAVEQNADLDKLSKLMDLQERWEANEARKAFVSALSAFKTNAPTITKNRNVSFGNTNYDHATLDNVVGTISPRLSEHGLAHGWAVDQSGGGIAVTCTLTHNMGHSESVTLSAPPDTSGSKNAIQEIASTVTYLERYTLLAITGLSTGDQDNDGAGAPARKTETSDDMWGGPLNKTKFKAAMMELTTSLGKCESLNELEALLVSNDALIQQCKTDMPTWWKGQEGSDVIGLDERITRHRDNFTNSSVYMFIEETGEPGGEYTSPNEYVDTLITAMNVDGANFHALWNANMTSLDMLAEEEDQGFVESAQGFYGRLCEAENAANKETKSQKSAKPKAKTPAKSRTDQEDHGGAASAEQGTSGMSPPDSEPVSGESSAPDASDPDTNWDLTAQDLLHDLAKCDDAGQFAQDNAGLINEMRAAGKALKATEVQTAISDRARELKAGA